MSGIVPPSPKAVKAFNESTARKNLFEGAVRSSKTNTSLLRWAAFVRYEAPAGYPLLMTGKTTDTLRQNILNDLETLVGRRNFRFNQKEGTLYGRKVLFRGADKTGSESKIRGFTFAGAYLDEKTLLDEEFCRQVGLRMSVEGAKEFATTNPGPPKHWLKLEMDRVAEGAFSSEQYRVFHFELRDNPSLTREYLEMLEVEYTGLWYERFVLGKWVAAEGLVYPFFREDLHTFTEARQATRYHVAIDYGTGNPTFFGLFGSNADACWLEREYRHSGRKEGQKTDSEYADDLDDFLAEKFDVEKHGARDRVQVIVDPSAASFKVELRKRNYRVRDANNDVIDGIRTYARLLKSGYYKIHKSCQHAIDEHGKYKWDSKAQERGEDKPVKEDDHAMDACRYYLHTLYGKPQTSDQAARALARGF